ncbi:MAG: glycosyltransferase family 4 protein, partial [Dehalococcoidia bacterium]|nr:glycosyltransferase family 4 protein [Dehalococcoidia bacterium]
DRVHPETSPKAQPMERHRLEGSEVVILHYSIWSQSAKYVLSLRPPRLVMIYHNITPSSYFRGFNPDAEQATLKGREALSLFAPYATLGLGDSEFNRRELEEAGFSRTGVLPIAVDFDMLDGPPSRRLLHELNDGRVNILSVGRIVPNKSLEDVIKLFYHYHHSINSQSRLFLVGPSDMGMAYLHWLEALIEHLGIQSHVSFPGRVAHPDLLAYYRMAKAYVCLSEHEGFCAPLVESMHLGVPVLAYASTAVPETMGEAGVLFRRKDYQAMAEVLDLLVGDEALREKLVAKGRQRALVFGKEQIAKTLREHLQTVIHL